MPLNNSLSTYFIERKQVFGIFHSSSMLACKIRITIREIRQHGLGGISRLQFALFSRTKESNRFTHNMLSVHTTQA